MFTNYSIWAELDIVVRKISVSHVVCSSDLCLGWEYIDITSSQEPSGIWKN